jgi:hypothetical protein
MDDIGTDILLERRNEFEVGGRRFTLYPPSLGVMMMMKGAIAALGLDAGLIAEDIPVALLAAVEKDRMQCCRIIALATCCGRKEAMRAAVIEDRAEYFSSNLEDEDIVTMLIEVIANNKVGQFLEASGISKENERLKEINRYKVSGTPTFGGQTLFGQMIDPAMDRYGWTYEYTVWGVSYAVLTVLLADRVTSVFLSDEEKKKIPKRLLDNDKISGDDPKNYARIIKEFS